MSMLCLFLLLSTPQGGMPSWARTVIVANPLSAAPPDASVWHLLDETTVTLRRDGKRKIQRRLIKVVLQEAAASQAGLFVMDGDIHTRRLRRLRGYHRAPGGAFEKLDKGDLITVNTSDATSMTTQTAGVLQFNGVGKGSVIVFESEETHESLFPIVQLPLSGRQPVARRILKVISEQEGVKPIITTHAFAEWGLTPNRSADRMMLDNLPAYEPEPLSGGMDTAYPRVIIHFPTADAAHLASWDAMAAWYYRNFFSHAGPSPTVTPNQAAASTNPAAIRDEITWFRKHITYRQRYLSPARAWHPEQGEEVMRRGYGDCKDMVACLAHRLAHRKAGLLPVLANIQDGPRTTEKDLPGPAFNHLIAAVPLTAPSGLGAEIIINDTPHLLVDPTARFTPVGLLPADYQGRQLMVCLPDGAHWIAVPDTALEQESVMVNVSGRLDKVYDLTGSLEVIEAGNALGLRTLHHTGNALDLLWTFRRRYGIPAAAQITLTGSQLTKDHHLRLAFSIQWPGFLRRDIDGMRLNESLAPWQIGRLVPKDRTRQLPLAIEALPTITWNLDLYADAPLQPGIAQADLTGELRTLSWRAHTAGKQLRITLQRSGKAVRFGRSELAEGVARFEAWRQQYMAFALEGTLFREGN